jgi:hypothetical protein
MRPTYRSPSALLPLLPSLFLAFRLVYIPAAVLSHTGHGLPWLTAVAGLVATFGLEALTRRGRRACASSTEGQARAALLLSLLIVGLFPEEAPIALILWAAIGAIWGRLSPPQAHGWDWAGLLGGGLLGLSGLFGPGSWLMAGILALWWFGRSAPD